VSSSSSFWQNKSWCFRTNS